MELTEEERRFIYQIMDEISVRGVDSKQKVVDIMRKMESEKSRDEENTEE